MNKTGTVGWEVTELPEVCYFQEGPGLRRWQYKDNGFPFINIRCIQNNRIDLSNVQYISVEEANSKYKHFQLDEGDLVMSSSGTLGRMAKVRAIDLPIMLNTSVIRFRSINEKKLSSDFLPHYLLGKEFLDQIAAESQGSAQVNFGPTHLKLVVCTLPSLPEQQKIAAILTSVDEVIESTQAQINKLKNLKTGMMQELLTRGIAHVKYKKISKWSTGRIAELDEIPETWELVNILSVAKLESGHTPSRDVQEYWYGDIPWVSLHDTKQLNVREINETNLNITQLGIDNSSARLLPKGTVVFSRTASVGHCVILGRPMATSQDFANYVCGPMLNNRYLMHLFKWSQHVWSNLSEGSTHQTIYMPIFKKLQILLPPVSEQIQIASAADCIDDKILGLEKKLVAQKNIKNALMQDLLTGKVRIKVS